VIHSYVIGAAGYKHAIFKLAVSIKHIWP